MSMREDNQYWEELAKNLVKEVTDSDYTFKKGADAFQEYFYLRLAHLTMVLRDVNRIKEECNLLLLTSGCTITQLKKRGLCDPLLECGLMDQNASEKVKTLWGARKRRIE